MLASLVPLVLSAAISGIGLTQLLVMLTTYALADQEVQAWLMTLWQRLQPRPRGILRTYERLINSFTTGIDECWLVMLWLNDCGYATHRHLLVEQTTPQPIQYRHAAARTIIRIRGSVAVAIIADLMPITLPSGAVVRVKSELDHNTTHYDRVCLELRADHQDAIDELLYLAARHYYNLCPTPTLRLADGSTWRPHSLTINRGLDALYWADANHATLVAIAADTRRGFVSRLRPAKHVLLISGPPGVGKTCVASMLANELSMNLYVLPQPFRGTITIAPETGGSADMMTKDYTRVLQDLIMTIQSPAIVLWDEFDLVHSEGDTDDRSFVTLARGFLNGDLISGVLVVLTTNYPERLCPIMTRTGRVDTHIRVEPATLDLKQRVCRDLGHDEALAAASPADESMSSFLGRL